MISAVADAKNKTYFLYFCAQTSTAGAAKDTKNNTSVYSQVTLRDSGMVKMIAASDKHHVRAARKATGHVCNQHETEGLKHPPRNGGYLETAT